MIESQGSILPTQASPWHPTLWVPSRVQVSEVYVEGEWSTESIAGIQEVEFG